MSPKTNPKIQVTRQGSRWKQVIRFMGGVEMMMMSSVFLVVLWGRGSSGGWCCCRSGSIAEVVSYIPEVLPKQLQIFDDCLDVLYCRHEAIWIATGCLECGVLGLNLTRCILWSQRSNYLNPSLYRDWIWRSRTSIWCRIVSIVRCGVALSRFELLRVGFRRLWNFNRSLDRVTNCARSAIGRGDWRAKWVDFCGSD